MSNAQVAQGVKLQRGDGASPEDFSNLVELTSVTGPQGSAAVIDTSSLDSTFATKLIGVLDEGQVNFEGHLLLDTQQDGMITDRAGKVLRTFRILLDAASPASYIQFTAYVTSFQPSFVLNQARTVSGTLEISGEVTWP